MCKSHLTLYPAACCFSTFACLSLATVATAKTHAQFELTRFNHWVWYSLKAAPKRTVHEHQRRQGAGSVTEEQRGFRNRMHKQGHDLDCEWQNSLKGSSLWSDLSVCLAWISCHRRRPEQDRIHSKPFSFPSCLDRYDTSQLIEVSG